MNKNKVLIALFSLMVLIGLSACQGQPAANTPGGEAAKTGADQSTVAPSTSSSNASVSVNPATNADGSSASSNASLSVNPATNADGSSASSNASATIVPADGKTPSPAEPPAEIKELLKMQDQLSAIVKEGNISKCKDLGMTQYVMSCEINVMLSSAKSKDDTAACDKASTKEIKDQCLMLLKNMPAKK